MFPKHSLDARNIATLREHSPNIPGILRAGWVVECYKAPPTFYTLNRKYKYMTST